MTATTDGVPFGLKAIGMFRGDEAQCPMCMTWHKAENYAQALERGLCVRCVCGHQWFPVNDACGPLCRWDTGHRCINSLAYGA